MLLNIDIVAQNLDLWGKIVISPFAKINFENVQSLMNNLCN